jgi:hypothetical protein
MVVYHRKIVSMVKSSNTEKSRKIELNLLGAKI